jgi:hypothetical protein
MPDTAPREDPVPGYAQHTGIPGTRVRYGSEHTQVPGTPTSRVYLQLAKVTKQSFQATPASAKCPAACRQNGSDHKDFRTWSLSHRCKITISSDEKTAARGCG